LLAARAEMRRRNSANRRSGRHVKPDRAALVIQLSGPADNIIVIDRWPRIDHQIVTNIFTVQSPAQPRRRRRRRRESILHDSSG